MADKKKIKVDEKALMENMGATVVPQPTTIPTQEKVVEVANCEADQQAQEVEDSAATVTVVESKKVSKDTPPPKHRKGSYEDLFLAKNVKGANAKLIQFRLPADTHKRLTTIIRAAHGSEISLIDYVNNVLLQHLHKYKDEIQRCYDAKQSDIVF